MLSFMSLIRCKAKADAKLCQVAKYDVREGGKCEKSNNMSPVYINHRIKELGMMLIKWKAQFELDFDREPKSRDIRNDSSIFVCYLCESLDNITDYKRHVFWIVLLQSAMKMLSDSLKGNRALCNEKTIGCGRYTVPPENSIITVSDVYYISYVCAVGTNGLGGFGCYYQLYMIGRSVAGMINIARSIIYSGVKMRKVMWLGAHETVHIIWFSYYFSIIANEYQGWYRVMQRNHMQYIMPRSRNILMHRNFRYIILDVVSLLNDDDDDLAVSTLPVQDEILPTEDYEERSIAPIALSRRRILVIIRKILHRELKKWKCEYAITNGRRPEVTDILQDEAMRDVYKAYQRLREETCKPKKEGETAVKYDEDNDEDDEDDENTREGTQNLIGTGNDINNGASNGRSGLLTPLFYLYQRWVLNDADAIETRTLAREVSEWRNSFKNTHGRNPNLINICMVPEIAEKYFRLKELKEKRESHGSEEESMDSPLLCNKDVSVNYTNRTNGYITLAKFEHEETVDRADTIAEEMLSFMSLIRCKAKADAKLCEIISPDCSVNLNEEIKSKDYMNDNSHAVHTDVLTASKAQIIADRRNRLVNAMKERMKDFKGNNKRAPTQSDMKSDSNTLQTYEAYVSIPDDIVERAKSRERVACKGSPANERNMAIKPYNIHRDVNLTLSNEGAKLKYEMLARKKELSNLLNCWKSEFEKNNDRVPYKYDLNKDAVAAALFEEFISLKKAIAELDSTIEQKKTKK